MSHLLSPTNPRANRTLSCRQIGRPGYVLKLSNALKPAKAQLHSSTNPHRRTYSPLGTQTYIDPSRFVMMGPHNYLSPESPIWPEMIFDDISGITTMDGADLEGVEAPTRTSFDPSLFKLLPALEGVRVPLFEDILAQTTSGCFTDIPLIENRQELVPSTHIGAALAEPFIMPGPWLSVGSPISTVSHISLATSPLEQISPWTTPGPLQASSPVAPIEGHYMFCPPPNMYLNGPELAPRWPPGQVDETTATSFQLPSSLSFLPYFDGQDQAWINEQLPTLGPLVGDMSLTGPSTALTTVYPPPVPLPAKSTMVGGKQSRQRLTKAGRPTK